MNKTFISENVVLYIEGSGESKFGTFHNYRSGEKAYLNADLLQIILEIIAGHRERVMKRVSDITDATKLLESLLDHGFLSENKAGGGLVKKVRSKPPLRVLFLETTKSCNLRCAHCYLGNPHAKNELSTAEILKLIADSDHMGVMEIQLTGGEIFVRKDASVIIGAVKELMIPCSIFTNGYYLPDDTLSIMKRNPHGFIFYISLDGFADTHDRFRGVTGAFQKTIRTIKLLLSSNVDVRINTAVGNHNIQTLSKFIRWVKNEYGVTHRLVSIDPIGRAKGGTEILTPFGQKKFKSIVSKFPEFLFLDSHDSADNEQWEIPACGVGSSMMFVNAHGECFPCPTMVSPMFQLGSTRVTTLKKIWEKIYSKKPFFKMQCKEIEQCEHRRICKGGCRSKAFLSTNDVNSPDTTMCDLYN